MAPFLRLFTYKTRHRPEYCTPSARKKTEKCIFFEKKWKSGCIPLHDGDRPVAVSK